MKTLFNLFNSSKLYIIPSLFLIFSGFNYYKYLVNKITFDYIEKKYKRKNNWEKDLDIYEISMPRFYTNVKKKKCILLIGGYKDIPYVWNELEKLLKRDVYDYYAPRTCGSGRSFFQILNWKDWVITYIEAIYLLQEQYETIDIISFSKGAVIALYISQFNYKCKINNIFLCAPFLLSKPSIIIDLFFSDNFLSYSLNRLFAWTFRYHIKSKNKYAGYRNTNNIFYSINDYCEIYGDIESETNLFNLIKLRPKTINASNIIILVPNDDDIIGDIGEQQKIIKKIFNKQINLINIPSYANNFDSLNLPQKCGHVMFKESPEIILNIYNNIKRFI